MLGKIFAGVSRRARDVGSAHNIRTSLHHLHGPSKVSLGPDEIGVVSLMLNAEWFIRVFIEHHQKLGVRHIVIVDNGSTDATAEIASTYDHVTVYRSRLPPQQYECTLRSHAARKVFSGGWILFADADELIEIAHGGVRPFERLLPYLDSIQATAMVGQMLDFYSQDAKLGESYSAEIENAHLYSLDSILEVPYHDEEFTFHPLMRPNTLLDKNVTFKRGGMRKEVFGERPCLSKHTIVKNLPGITPMVHPHVAAPVTVADVTFLIRHYKFSSNWRERDKLTAAACTWSHGEDSKRLASQVDHIRTANPRRWKTAETLVDEGFLYVSPRARAALTADAFELALQ